MTRSLHPPCIGSAAYGPHTVKVQYGYTVIGPGGKVWYACDADCIRKHLEHVERQAMDASVSRSVAFLWRGGRR